MDMGNSKPDVSIRSTMPQKEFAQQSISISGDPDKGKSAADGDDDSNGIRETISDAAWRGFEILKAVASFFYEFFYQPFP